MGEVVPGVWEPMDGLARWDPLRGGYAFLDRTDGGHTYHCGADLNGGQGGDGDLGAALRFPIAGVVVYVGRWNGSTTGYGNHVWLRLVNGDYLHYCHCDSIQGVEGTVGAAGQVVARCGKSGNQMWAHCHFEVKREDPALAGYESLALTGGAPTTSASTTCGRRTGGGSCSPGGPNNRRWT